TPAARRAYRAPAAPSGARARACPRTAPRAPRATSAGGSSARPSRRSNPCRMRARTSRPRAPMRCSGGRAPRGPQSPRAARGPANRAMRLADPRADLRAVGGVERFEHREERLAQTAPRVLAEDRVLGDSRADRRVAHLEQERSREHEAEAPVAAIAPADAVHV